MLEMPKTAPKRPMKAGLRSSGRICVIRVIMEIIMPEAPRPVIARPTMSALMFGAAPATTDPISKMVMQTRKTYLRGGGRG